MLIPGIKENGYRHRVGDETINLRAIMNKPRAIKTHFKLSSLNLSLLESSNASFQVPGWGPRPRPADASSLPLPACRNAPSSRVQALQELCRAGRCAWQFGEEGQRGTILAHTSEHWLGIFHSFIIWLLRHSHWL